MFKGQKFTYLEMHEVKPSKFAKKSKHAASKKGHKHQHNLSKGQVSHLKFINGTSPYLPVYNEFGK